MPHFELCLEWGGVGDTELPRVVRIGKEEKGDLPEQGGDNDNMNGHETGFYLSATW